MAVCSGRASACLLLAPRALGGGARLLVRKGDRPKEAALLSFIAKGRDRATNGLLQLLRHLPGIARVVDKTGDQRVPLVGQCFLGLSHDGPSSALGVFLGFLHELHCIRRTVICQFFRKTTLRRSDLHRRLT